jgi:AcrR family transcriptional regulator
MPVPAKPMRVDARRNYEKLLRAARLRLERDGADFVFEDVAIDAAVGKGTLYRHFPTKDHLLAAVLGSTFDELAERARSLGEEKDRWSAYATWLEEFDRMPSVYRGMQARLAAAMQDDSSAIAEACVPMKLAFGRLLAGAQASGAVRSDLQAPDVLAVVAALPPSLRVHGGVHPYLRVLLDGTRARTP